MAAFGVVDSRHHVCRLTLRYRWPVCRVRKRSQNAAIGLIQIHPVKYPGIGARVPDPCSLSSTTARLVHAGFAKFPLQAPQCDPAPRRINDGINALHSTRIKYQSQVSAPVGCIVYRDPTVGRMWGQRRGETYGTIFRCVFCAIRQGAQGRAKCNLPEGSACLGKDVSGGRSLAHFVLAVREVMALRRWQILRQKGGTAKQ